MSDLIYAILAVIVIVVLIVFGISTSRKQKKYMVDQKQNNTDKNAMLDLMSRAMEGAYSDYSYVVGYYTKVKQRFNETTYYYFPYIIAFSQSEMQIFPFVKDKGQLYLRGHLTVDWNATKFQYKLRKNGLTLTIKMVGDTMPIHIDPVIKSGGEEKSDRPICVYQEQEVEKLKGYLEGYRSMAKS